MFSKIRRRFRDMSTIKTLCLGAERHANADGQKEPGAEHFVLAALDLPDATARKAFARIDVDAKSFRSAITQQYADALRNIGIEMPQPGPAGDDAVPRASAGGIYRAQPSAQTLMQQLAGQQKNAAGVPLLGAHVIMAAANAQYGVAIRALKALGIDPAKLRAAAQAEIDAVSRPHS
jgi:ATP-dependent Clp protease ATP-binding subunit ClpA